LKLLLKGQGACGRPGGLAISQRCFGANILLPTAVYQPELGQSASSRYFTTTVKLFQSFFRCFEKIADDLKNMIIYAYKCHKSVFHLPALDL